MFRRKSKDPIQTDTSKKTPAKPSKYSDAIGWESSRLSLAEASEARAWFTAKLLGATSMALVVAIVVMMPLKETLPYVIEVDKSTGMSTILSVANAEEVLANSPCQTSLSRILGSLVRTKTRWNKRSGTPNASLLSF